MLTSVEIDSAFSLRLSLTLCPALLSRSLILGRLRLEMIHLMQENIENF